MADGKLYTILRRKDIMKRILSFVLAAIMLLSIGACGNKDGDVAGGSNDSDTVAVSGKKVYQIATDTTFAPFEFENDEGNMVGIDLELLAAIAEDQGFEYELQVVGFSAAVTALEAGEADGVIAGMSITDERKVKYDFSDAYYDSGVGMGILKDSGITAYEDLRGKQVATKMGTEGNTFAESIQEEYGFTITQFEDSSTMYQDVLSGASVACFEDYPVLGYEISRGLDLTLPLDMEKGNSYGFAVMKGENQELLEMFNKGLENLKSSGKYDEILNTYISK